MKIINMKEILFNTNIVKKNFFLKYVIISALAINLSACDDYLDEIPDNRVTLDDLEKSAQLLTNAYSIGSYAFTDWMSDNVGFTTGVTIRLNQEQTYNWEDVTAGPTEQDTPIFFWFQTYEAIAHANEVLAILDELPIENDEDERRKRAIESEALLTRAYGHFMLVNLFGQHYNAQEEGENSQNLGVPYVTQPETVFIQQYTRNSVQQVYDLVEEDLLRGIELLDDSFFANSGKYHFNRGAALAFASRFYLFKGDYQRCVEYSSLLLGSEPGAFVRDLTSQEFLVASSSAQNYPQLYNSPDLQSNLLLIRKISLVQRLDFAHGPSRDIYDGLFSLNPFPGTTDQRENPAFVKGGGLREGIFPVRYESLFQRSSLNSNVGTPYHIAIAFRGEEVLLNRAESYLLLNRGNDALSDLQILVDNRYSGDDATLTLDRLRSVYGTNIDDITMLYLYIQLERRKEFITQGMRWFDLKRRLLDDIVIEHDLIDGSIISLELDDPRTVLQIPQSAIDVGGLKANPR